MHNKQGFELPNGEINAPVILIFAMHIQNFILRKQDVTTNVSIRSILHESFFKYQIQQ